MASALTPTVRLPMIEDAMYPAFPFTPTPLRRAVIGMPAHQAGDADREYRLIRHAPSFAQRNPGFTPVGLVIRPAAGPPCYGPSM